MRLIYSYTSRYKGFSGTLDAVRRLGLLSSAKEDAMILDPAEGGWSSLGVKAVRRQLKTEVKNVDELVKAAFLGSGADYLDTWGSLARSEHISLLLVLGPLTAFKC